MLTQFQGWIRNNIMHPNRSIKYLSSNKNTFGSIRGSIYNIFTQFQVWNHNDLMIPNGSIKSLSRSENTFSSIKGSIKNVLYTVSSEELK